MLEAENKKLRQLTTGDSFNNTKKNFIYFFISHHLETGSIMDEVSDQSEATLKNEYGN